ncbi:MAG: hypothetical protein AAFZ52_16825 [Bacteroidota bacterium]
MRFCLLFTLLFSAFTSLEGQIAWPVPTLPTEKQAGGEVDLNGIWTGELLQNPGGIAEKFDFSMQLRHNGLFLQGTSFVRFGEIYVEMELSGTREPNGSWKLTETKILRGEKPPELSWCIKKYELRVYYTKEGLRLSGPWWGDSEYGACVPGSVHLIRKKKTV